MSAQHNTRPIPPKAAFITIAVRIALLAWLVALVTLFVFVMFTIPHQKQLFITSLASKANSLSVSLYDVAASAAVNEDYSMVVSAAQTLLEGDPELEFLVMVKNDGFALVVEHNRWRDDRLTDSHWLRNDRRPFWDINVCPLFQRRLFHLAHPFDYSGIQWGWIHVGLSIKTYDESVATLYQRTGFLAFACIVISLICSVFYARHMVRPVLRLQMVVHQIAQGNLSAKADTRRKDELGSLAESVNTMAQALHTRNQILECVRFAAERFLEEQSWEAAIGRVLEKTGRVAGATGAMIYENFTTSSGGLYARRLFKWDVRGTESDQHPPVSPVFDLDTDGTTRLTQHLSANQIYAQTLGSCNQAEQKIFEKYGIKSVIAIPVFSENIWWGAIVLEDCKVERTWAKIETGSMEAIADMLGATIARQRFQKALVDAKTNLEEMVAQRTWELQDQIKVKEQALSDLSSAQSSLIEMSRAAGMAEVATGVLHNVGNVLNSVNVSATLLMDTLRESRIKNITKIAQMMNRSPRELADFIAQDPRGQKIPAYLMSLGQALANEHARLNDEAQALAGRIAHIKEIVSMQQSYGRVSGLSETIRPSQLMDDALMLNEKELAQHEIIVKKEYEDIPQIAVDIHKVLQILINLIRNAKNACTDSGKTEKQMILKIQRGQANMVKMTVIDNGIGIRPENLTRIFQHGFTTRQSGHGFGLHSGALAARQLHGRLTAASDGPGKGAAFSLELPVFTKEKA